MIAPDKLKTLFVLHQQGLSIRKIARQLAVSRQSVRRAIAQQGVRVRPAFVPPVDPELVRSLHTQCQGYVQRVWEKLREEHGVKVKYSTLTRWLRQLGIGQPPTLRCQRVPDQPGAEMQHDTSPYTIRLGTTPTKLQASLLYLRYSKRRYLQFYRVFDRFRMKCFLHQALVHWGYAPGLCVIDNTNLARLHGLGSQAVMVPEMDAFAKNYGFRFLCHAPKHSDRKAGEERSFWTVETNFLTGRTFENLEDLNRQALDWSTVRMEQRAQGKAGLIPAQAFEHEVHFLHPLPPGLPAPHLVLERSVDEYGYVAVDANYYWVPGTGRGRLTVLRYENHLHIYVDGQSAVQYPLAPDGVRNQQFDPPDKPPHEAHPRHRPQPSDEEEKRLRALAPALSAYVDFLLATPGHLRHQTLRRLWALSQQMSPDIFVRAVQRAHHYRVHDLKSLERIAHLYLLEVPGQIPLPAIDPSFRDRPAYQDGALTETPNLTSYDE